MYSCHLFCPACKKSIPTVFSKIMLLLLSKVDALSAKVITVFHKVLSLFIKWSAFLKFGTEGWEKPRTMLNISAGF